MPRASANSLMAISCAMIPLAVPGARIGDRELVCIGTSRYRVDAPWLLMIARPVA